MHLSKYVFFSNFTLASHLQRHQLCGSGQWSVLRFVAIHVAEMECLHESSRRGEGRISLIAVFRLTMSWIPLDTHFCIYLNFWEFQKPHETVWDELRLPPHSTSGRCLSFDYQAAGYVLGECSISVVLKPYAEKAVGKHDALCRFFAGCVFFFSCADIFLGCKTPNSETFYSFWSGFVTTVRSHNVRGIFATTKLYLQRWRFSTKRICRCGRLYVCMALHGAFETHFFGELVMDSWIGP